MPEDELEWRFRELTSRIEKVESQHNELDRRTISAAYSVGAALATVLSWNAHQAIALAALHGLFSWFYVAYYIATNWGHLKFF
jgi:hypothetical protein